MLRRFVALSVSLTWEASLLQVSNHEVINCKAAAIRYHADYGQDGCRQDINCDAFAHFKERGKFIGRIWQ